jgi:hypothetical protein
MGKLLDRVDFQHLNTPHFVEWASSEEANDEDWDCKYFAERSEAIECAEEKRRDGFAACLGEIGIYQTGAGNQIRDYIYYWWNEYFVTKENSGRGIGFPHHAQNVKLDYTPVDTRDFRARADL